jgi:hypothetical protein
VSELIGTLDVEERARAKDGCGKGVETFAANMVQKKNSFALRKNKKKKRSKRTTQNPSRQLSLRRRTIITRREVALFVVVMSIG